jgi:predicted ArsR family transcriptional regulator
MSFLTYYVILFLSGKLWVGESMSTAKIDARFFESTRGRIVTLLRRRNLTVNDLAKELDLTDNAVRAHLLSLERDGLVAQQGTIKGFRKPHYIYGLSDRAAELFPPPYGALFTRLLSSLKSALTKASFVARLRDVGQSIGAENKIATSDKTARVEKALSTIEELGGSANVYIENGEEIIRSESCPFSEAVAEHPEVCKVTESMLAEILDSRVEEKCDRSSKPKCKFAVISDRP